MCLDSVPQVDAIQFWGRRKFRHCQHRQRKSPLRLHKNCMIHDCTCIGQVCTFLHNVHLRTKNVHTSEVSAKGASAFWDTKRLNKNLHAWTQYCKWLHFKSGKALVIVGLLDVRVMHPKVLADAAVVMVLCLTKQGHVRQRRRRQDVG